MGNNGSIKLKSSFLEKQLIKDNFFKLDDFNDSTNKGIFLGNKERLINEKDSNFFKYLINNGHKLFNLIILKK